MENMKLKEDITKEERIRYILIESKIKEMNRNQVFVEQAEYESSMKGGDAVYQTMLQYVDDEKDKLIEIRKALQNAQTAKEILQSAISDAEQRSKIASLELVASEQVLNGLIINKQLQSKQILYNGSIQIEIMKLLKVMISTLRATLGNSRLVVAAYLSTFAVQFNQTQNKILSACEYLQKK
ncbi:MAG: hypothetical protein EZS28_003685 [Streblomastix strix]|uniref:Uncharacterized protein n=1 Tax=Streblomastix strix TaxID=222440 RepID=A0A5J4X233_9EUKA|nr:MAG: hypothetical protein EZS28_003685 [Streblomastix strix]